MMDNFELPDPFALHVFCRALRPSTKKGGALRHRPSVISHARSKR